MPAFKNLLSTCLLLVYSLSANAELPVVKVAVLQFGTLNWEIDVIRHHQLDQKYNFTLDVMPVGSKNASTVALQSGTVDVIYSDWVWVNRQRFNNRFYGFSPVSAAAGGVYVQPHLSSDSLSDLDGLRMGIAGGSVDKSWLLLQAYSKKTIQKDITENVTPVFAAPPLLNKLMFDNKLSASLNFWHYSARLKARSFNPVITVDQILKGLGIQTQVPLVGWVFAEEWAEANKETFTNFLKASEEAREILMTSEKEWQRIKPLTRSENDQIFTTLINEYRRGLLAEFGSKEVKALEKLYSILASEGGKKLTGGAMQLDTQLFWMPSSTSGVSRVVKGG
ncbi:MAG: ABC transporter substrate-binding protein [Neptuniibacter sp.]